MPPPGMPPGMMGRGMPPPGMPPPPQGPPGMRGNLQYIHVIITIIIVNREYFVSKIFRMINLCIETTKILCGQLNVQCTTCRRFD